MKKCSKCPAYFDGKRWIYKLKREPIKIKKGEYSIELCPGCEKIEKKWIEGIVQIRGNFWKKHKEEVEKLVQHTAERKRERTPSARIYRFVKEKDELIIETTDRALAERIGKDLEKAFSGELDIQWLKKAEYSRVYWQKD